MDYKKLYYSFIADRKLKEPECYKNINYTYRVKLGSMYSGECLVHHHIVPKHLGGTNHHLNIVSLTPYDHYFAHLLFAKAVNTVESWRAVTCMVLPFNCERLSSAKHRKMFNKAVKLACVDNNPSKKQSNRLKLSELKKKINPMHNKKSLEKMKKTRLRQQKENPERNVIYRVSVNNDLIPLKTACDNHNISYFNVVSMVFRKKCTHQFAFDYYFSTSIEERKSKKFASMVATKKQKKQLVYGL